jgi:aryl-alcohol dehydrogenase-like predicted oxidoreductase
MSKEKVQTDPMTPEEERTYWDAQDPLRQGRKARVQHPEPSEKPLSYFALRLGGKDISRLAEIAKRRGMKPSELARAFILQGLEQTEKHNDLEQRISILEIELGEVKQKLYHR